MELDVLIVDDRSRAALAACRSLGGKGLAVGVLGSPNSLAATSKYCAKAYPSKNLTSEVVRDILSQASPSLLLPVTDSALSLCQHFPEKLPYGAVEKLSLIQDKSKLLSLAEGIRVPITAPYSESQNWNTFPCVVKERSAQGWSGQERPKQGVKYCASATELENLSLEGEYIIQELIPGSGVGVFALCDRGEPLVLFAHERLLEKPPSGGVSVLSRSITLDDAPVEEAKILLKQLNWSGVAMVEFKKTHDGFVLMEINPRLWGSLQLAISSGVDFPWLIWLWQNQMLDSAEGRAALGAAGRYQAGLRLRWDLGCIDHLLIRIKSEGLSALRAVAINNELLLFKGQTIHETLSLTDPAPFGRELYSWLRGTDG